MNIVIKTDRTICINPKFLQVSLFDSERTALIADDKVLKLYANELDAMEDLDGINKKILDGYNQRDTLIFIDLRDYYFVDSEDIPF